MKVVCIIPARYASTRFPGKPLAELAGKPMVQWVYERAKGAKTIQDVIVATDDKRIFDVVQAFGGKAVMTTGDYQSGTDRIADVARDMDCDAVVNLQGDEPWMNPETLDLSVRALAEKPYCDVSTAMIKITDEKTYLSPNAVKAVCASDGIALYFSRSPIPSRSRAQPEFAGFWGFKHLGLYVYRKEALLAFPRLKPTFLERLECLEQIRFLENGYKIKVVETPHDSTGIDTPEDLQSLKDMIKNNPR